MALYRLPGQSMSRELSIESYTSKLMLLHQIHVLTQTRSGYMAGCLVEVVTQCQDCFGETELGLGVVDIKADKVFDCVRLLFCAQST